MTLESANIPRPARRPVPLALVVLLAMAAVIVLGAALVPAPEGAPAITWRGNAGTIEAQR